MIRKRRADISRNFSEFAAVRLLEQFFHPKKRQICVSQIERFGAFIVQEIEIGF